MKGFKRTLLGILVFAVAVLAACGSKAYRTVEVTDFNGAPLVNSKEATKGMHLVTGDNVNVPGASDMTLLLDADKHVYASENTKFSLVADGEKDSTKTVIKLAEGSVLSEIDNKLGPNESYQVDTPTATMSVRGTKFTVTVYTEGGVTYTEVSVTEGTVVADLKNEDGSYNGLSKTLEAGDEAVIVATENGTEFVDETADASASGTEDDGTIDYETAKENESHWVLVEDEYNEEGDYAIYDAEGRVIEEASSYGTKREYQYNADGTYRVDYYSQAFDAAPGEYTYMGYCIFDEYDYELSGHRAWSVYDGKNGNFSDYSYEYDFYAPGKPTRVQYVSAEFGPGDYDIYTYDEHGNVTSKTPYDRDGNVMEYYDTEYYEYVEIGGDYYVSHEVYQSNEEGSEFSITLDYEYDEYGNLIHENRVSIDYEGTYTSDTVYEYSFLAFPAGNPGDTITRYVTTTEIYSDGDSYSYTDELNYIYK